MTANPAPAAMPSVEIEQTALLILQVRLEQLLARNLRRGTGGSSEHHREDDRGRPGHWLPRESGPLKAADHTPLSSP